MIIFSVLFLLLGCTTSNARNVNVPSTMYEVIAKSCTNLNLNDTSFINQNVFKQCTSWTDINKTTKLTKENEGNVLCLLYYDSFMSFCSDLKSAKTSNVTIDLVPDLKDLDIYKICTNVTLFPVGKKFEHGIDKILNEHTCMKLCQHYNGSVVTECALAYYFANYNISKLIQEPIQEPEEKLPSANAIVTKTNSSGKPSEHYNLVGSSKGDFNTIKNKNGAGQPQDIPEKFAFNQNSETGPNSNSGKSTSVSMPGVSGPVSMNAGKVFSPEQNAHDKSQMIAKTEESILKKNLTDNSQDEGTTDGIKGTDTEFTDKLEIGDHGEDGNPDAGNGNGSENEKPDNSPKNSLPPDGEKEIEKSELLTMPGDSPANFNNAEDLDGESYFFSYFMVICVLFVLGYVGYHNRQKVLALVLEGKRGRRQARGRRPNSANYHKLDSNLEEAISSTCTKNSSNVIY